MNEFITKFTCNVNTTIDNGWLVWSDDDINTTWYEYPKIGHIIRTPCLMRRQTPHDTDIRWLDIIEHVHKYTKDRTYYPNITSDEKTNTTWYRYQMTGYHWTCAQVHNNDRQEQGIKYMTLAIYNIRHSAWPNHTMQDNFCHIILMYLFTHA